MLLGFSVVLECRLMPLQGWGRECDGLAQGLRWVAAVVGDGMGLQVNETKW